MMREKPCPYRIVDDLGGGFTIGFMLGSVWHFARGMYYSPKSQKFYGGVLMLKKRAPILAGSFALWAALYSMCQCSMISLRNQDDWFNKVFSGFVTGGLLTFRSGRRVAFKNALFGGILLGSFGIFEKIMMKYQKRQQLEMQNQFTEKQNREARRQLAKRRPDLFAEDGTPRMYGRSVL